MQIDGTVTGGLALAWLVIKELLAMLKPILLKNINGNGGNGKSDQSNKAGEQTKDWWEMKFAAIIEAELDKFFEKRDLTLREIIRQEIEKSDKNKLCPNT